jgi:ABC-type glycerol-3-phosphate transport system substrate-binding protein
MRLSIVRRTPVWRTVLLLLLVLVASCGPRTEADEPPATVAETATPATATATALPAAPPTTQPATIAIEFWTTDQQPERLAAYEAVAARFVVAHPG